MKASSTLSKKHSNWQLLIANCAFMIAMFLLPQATFASAYRNFEDTTATGTWGQASVLSTDNVNATAAYAYPNNITVIQGYEDPLPCGAAAKLYVSSHDSHIKHYWYADQACTELIGTGTEGTGVGDTVWIPYGVQNVWHRMKAEGLPTQDEPAYLLNESFENKELPSGWIASGFTFAGWSAGYNSADGKYFAYSSGTTHWLITPAITFPAGAKGVIKFNHLTTNSTANSNKFQLCLSTGTSNTSDFTICAGETATNNNNNDWPNGNWSSWSCAIGENFSGAPVYYAIKHTTGSQLLIDNVKFYYYYEDPNPSPTTAELITITPQTTSQPTPEVPSQVSAQYGTPVTLTVGNYYPGLNYEWSIDANFDSIVGRGHSVTVFNTTGDHNYYVRSNGSDCYSESAVVHVNVTNIPILGLEESYDCGSNAKLYVGIHDSRITHYWYADSACTQLIGTGDTLQMPVLADDTVWHRMQASITQNNPIYLIQEGFENFTFQTDFEPFMNSAWSVQDVDRDGNTWYIWGNSSSTHTGNLGFGVRSYGYTRQQDNKFYTPTFTIPTGATATLKLWHKQVLASLIDKWEQWVVYYFNGTSYSPAYGYTVKPAADWEQWTLDLSSHAGTSTNLMFRHNYNATSNGMFAFDDIEVSYYFEDPTSIAPSIAERIILDVEELPIVELQASEVSALCGDTVTLTVANYVQGLNYEWSRNQNFDSIVGTGGELAIANSAGEYTYFVRSSNGICHTEATEATVTVTALTAPVLQVSEVTIQRGNAVTLSLTNYDQDFSYEWSLNDPDFTQENIVGSGSELMVNNLTGEYTYYVRCSNNSCHSEAAMAQVNIIDTIILGYQDPIACGTEANIHAATHSDHLIHYWYADEACTQLIGTGTDGTGVGDAIRITVTENDTIWHRTQEILPTESNPCVLVKEGFENGLNGWSVQDLNNDGNTWKIITSQQYTGTHCVALEGASAQLQDCLLTPTFTIPSGATAYFKIHALWYDNSTRGAWVVRYLKEDGTYGWANGYTHSPANYWTDEKYVLPEAFSGLTTHLLFTLYSGFGGKTALDDIEVHYYYEAANMPPTPMPSEPEAIILRVTEQPIPVLHVAEVSAPYGEPVTLTVKNVLPGLDYEWSTDPDFENIVGTGIGFTVYNLPGNYTYYVKSSNDFCHSEAATAHVTVNDIVIHGNEEPVVCGADTKLYTETNSNRVVHYWYADQACDHLIGTGDTLHISLLSDSTVWHRAQTILPTQNDPIYLLNQGFENGMDGWSVSDEDGDGKTWEITNSYHKSGSHSIHLTNSKPVDDALFSPTIAIPTGTNVWVSVSAKTYAWNSPCDAWLAQYYDGSGYSGIYAYQSGNNDATTFYTQTKDMSSILAGMTTHLKLRIHPSYAVGGSTALDDIQLYYYYANPVNPEPTTAEAITLQVADQPTPVLQESEVVANCGAAATLVVDNYIPGLVYEWSKDPDFDSIVGTGYEFPINDPIGEYTYYVRSHNGNCLSDAAQAHVSVSAPIIPELEEYEVTTYYGIPYTLVVTNYNSRYSYEWSTDADFENIVGSGDHITNRDFTTNGEYTYYVRSYDENCRSEATSAHVSVTGIPVHGNEEPIVCGTEATLSADVHDEHVKHYWYADEACTQLISITDVLQIPITGTDTVWHQAKADITADNPVLMFSEGFDNKALPAGWTNHGWNFYGFSGGAASYDGLYFAYSASPSSSGNWLITPAIQLPSGANGLVVYGYRSLNPNNNTFSLCMSQASLDLSDFTQCTGANTISNGSWSDGRCSFGSNWSEQPFYISWKHTNSASSDGLLIDKVRMYYYYEEANMPAPAPVEAFILQVTEPTSPAILGAEEPIVCGTRHKLYAETHDDHVTHYWYADQECTDLIATGDTLQLPSLFESQTIWHQIQRALPSDTNRRYLVQQDFESSMDGWRTVDRDGDGRNWNWVYAYQHSGGSAMISQTVDGNYAENDLITPALAIPTGATATATWWTRNTDPNFLDTYYLMYSTDGINFSNFNPTREDTPGTTYVQRTQDLSAFAGSTIYLAWRHKCTDKNTLAIDDIEVSYYYDFASTPCASTVEAIELQVTDQPTPEVPAEVTATCGDTITLTVENYYPDLDYEWSTDPRFYSNSIVGTGEEITVINPTGNYTYYVRSYKVNPNAEEPAPAMEVGEDGLVTLDFAYTGAEQTWTIPASINPDQPITLEVWGAQGGDGGSSNLGGRGGYSTGQLTTFNPGDVLYINVGGQGEGSNISGDLPADLQQKNTAGGYNGGGNGYQNNFSRGAGGGATHIATASGLLKDLADNQSAVKIVAGGGGGNGYHKLTSGTIMSYTAGVGGGTSGGNGKNNTSSGQNACGRGGSQTSGFSDGYDDVPTTIFGLGQSSEGSTVAGGGGGWYGGGDGNPGGGGSGYIGGVSNGTTTAGTSSFAAPNGGNETGHPGNGYARITFYVTAAASAETNNNCQSDTAEVHVSVTTPAIPEGITVQGNEEPIVCGTNATLYVSTHNDNIAHYWFADSACTDLIGTGDTLIIPVFATDTVWHQVDEYTSIPCPSVAEPIILNVIDQPTPNVPAEVSADCGVPVTLTVENYYPDLNYEWSLNDPDFAEENIVGEGPEITVTHLGGDYTYYVRSFKDDPNATAQAQAPTSGEGGELTLDFDYTGGEQTWTIPANIDPDQPITLEVWGAQGGNGSSNGTTSNSAANNVGGKGGYATGQLTDFYAGQTLYINVGGQGKGSNINGNLQEHENEFLEGGYNGGGNSYQTNRSRGSGGGATHIATASGLLKDLSDNRDAVKIVAGGGGGNLWLNANTYYLAGAGGGTTGTDGYRPNQTTAQESKPHTTGGTQNSGGTPNSSSATYTAAGFGMGGSATPETGNIFCGGGGGWYGGGYGNPAGGGSGYKGGVANGTTTAGNSSFPAPNGGNETGHPGNGYARITYYVTAAAPAVTGCQSETAEILLRVTEATPAPENLTISDITPESATASWDAGHAAAWEYSYDGNTWYPTDTNAVALTGLSIFTTYTFQVKSVVELAECEVYVAEQEFTTTEYCDRPTDLAVSDITEIGANLSWTPGDEEESWYIEYGINSDFSDPDRDTVEDNAYTFPCLLPGSTYYVRVMASCGSGWVYTTFNTFADPEPGNICLTPENLVAEPFIYRSTLTWSAGNGTKWQVRINGTYYEVEGDPTFTIRDLTPETEYTAKVRTDCGECRYSEWATVTFTTLEACPKPSEVVADNITFMGANLSWTPGRDEESWVIEYSTDSEFTDSQTDTAYTNPYVLSCLAAASTYYVRVSSNCDGELSVWDTTSFTTLTAPENIAGAIEAGTIEICQSEAEAITIGSVTEAVGGEYRWTENGTVIPDITSATYTIPADAILNGTPGDYIYTREAYDACTDTWMTSTNSFTVTIREAPDYSVINILGNEEAVVCGTDAKIYVDEHYDHIRHFWYADKECTTLIGTGTDGTGWGDTVWIPVFADDTIWHRVQEFVPTANDPVFPLQDNFETHPTQSGWQILDQDNDGQTWTLSTPGYGADGGAIMFSTTQGGQTPDNWLISPALEIPAGTNVSLKWKSKNLNNKEGDVEVPDYITLPFIGEIQIGSHMEHYDYNDTYTVRISTNGPEVDNFTQLGSYHPAGGGDYTNHTINLTSYAGNTIWIAFRHTKVGEASNYIMIDDVELSCYYDNPEIPCPSIAEPVVLRVTDQPMPELAEEKVTTTCGIPVTLAVENYYPDLDYEWSTDPYFGNIVGYGHELTVTNASGDYTYYVRSFKDNPNPNVGEEEQEPVEVIDTIDFEYTGEEQSYTILPNTSNITLQVWGAQGGDAGTTKAGRDNKGGGGGYSTGQLTDFRAGDVLYVNVGGQGEGIGLNNGEYTNSLPVKLISGGYNGGGNGYRTGYPRSGGGGATHIATASGLLKDLANNQSAVKIVAGGGGGAGAVSWANLQAAYCGGLGGGNNGTQGYRLSATSTSNGSFGGGGGTLTAAGSNSEDRTNFANGGFGFGGGAIDDNTSTQFGCGGGGGWYGGGYGNMAGGGGSGHIGTGVTGNTYAASMSHTLDNEGYGHMQYTNPFPAPNGGNETGHDGDGYARIIVQRIVSDDFFGCRSEAAMVEVTVESAPAVTWEPAEAVCGEDVTINLTNTIEGYTYEWYENNEPIFTGTSYTLEALTEDATFTIQSYPTNSSLAEECAISSDITIALKPVVAPVVSVSGYAKDQENDVYFCGTPVTFTITNDTADMARFDYVWFSDEECTQPLNDGMSSTTLTIGALNNIEDRTVFVKACRMNGLTYVPQLATCVSDTTPVAITIAPIDPVVSVYSYDMETFEMITKVDICEGDEISLIGNNDYSGDTLGYALEEGIIENKLIWYRSDGNGDSTLVGITESDMDLTVSESEPGTYYYYAFGIAHATADEVANSAITTTWNEVGNDRGTALAFSVNNPNYPIVIDTLDVYPYDDNAATNVTLYYAPTANADPMDADAGWETVGEFQISKDGSNAVPIILGDNAIEIPANSTYTFYLSSDRDLYYNIHSDNNQRRASDQVSGAVLYTGKAWGFSSGCTQEFPLPDCATEEPKMEFAGNIHITMHGGNFCISETYAVDTVVVHAQPTTPTLAVRDNLNYVCPGDPDLTLVATAEVTGDDISYVWTVDGEYLTTTAEDTLSVAIPDDETIEQVVYGVSIVSLSCGSTEEATTTVYFSVAPVVADIADDTLCAPVDLNDLKPEVEGEEFLEVFGWQYADDEESEEWTDIEDIHNINTELNGKYFRFFASSRCKTGYSNAALFVIDSLPYYDENALETPEFICAGNPFNWEENSAEPNHINNSGRETRSGWNLFAGDQIINITAENADYEFVYNSDPDYYQYNCYYIVQCGDAEDSIVSNTVTIPVWDVPTIDEDVITDNTPVCAGNPIGLEAPQFTPYGEPTAFGWEYADYPGARFNRLSDGFEIMDDDFILDYDMNGKLVRYYVETPCGTAVSNAVQLVISDIPQLAAITAPETVCDGTPFAMDAPEVTENGGLEVSGDWYVIIGQNDAIKVGADAIITEEWDGSGLFYLAENDCGTVSTDTVTMSVYPAIGLEAYASMDGDTRLEGNGCFGPDYYLIATVNDMEDVEFTWSNQETGDNIAITRPESGTYEYIVTATMGTGCIATDTVRFTVDEVITFDTTINVCYGELPYEFDSQREDALFENGGDYELTYQTPEGCDSIVTLHLNVYRATVAHTNTHICNGESYVWEINGMTYGGTGIADTTLTDTVYVKGDTWISDLGNHEACDSVIHTLRLIISDGIFLDIPADDFTVGVGEQVSAVANVRMGCQPTDAKTILSYQLYKDGELVDNANRYGALNFTTYLPQQDSRFSTDIAEGTGNIPGTTFNIYNYAFNYFYAPFFDEIDNQITATWNEPGEYEIKFVVAEMTNGQDYPLTYPTNVNGTAAQILMGGAGATPTGLTLTDTASIFFHVDGEPAEEEEPELTGTYKGHLDIDTTLFTEEVNATSEFTLSVIPDADNEATKLAIDYEMYRNGEMVATGRYGNVHFQTLLPYQNRWFGNDLTGATGSIPTNTFTFVNYNFDYFYNHFMESTDHQFTAVWNQPGEYKVKFILRERTAGQDIPLPYDNRANLLIGGHGSSNGAIISTDSVVFYIKGETVNIELNETICEENLPFEYNGLTFTESTTDPVTIPDVNGIYDTLLTVNLTVINNDTVRFEETVCDSYVWNEEEFTVSGVYERTFENIYGCDSVVILNLTVIGEPRLSINAPFTTVCAGASDVPVTATVSYLEGIDNATTLSFTNEETSRDTTNGIVTVSYATSFSELLNSTTLTAQSVNTANGVTCTAVDTVEITVIPVDSIATLTASVCQGEAFDRDDEWDEAFTFGISSERTQNAIDAENRVPVELRDTIITGTNSCGVYRAELILTVNPSFTANDPVVVEDEVCEGYDYDGNYGFNFSADEIADMLENATANIVIARSENESSTGCDSITELRLTVLPSARSEAYDTVCNVFYDQQQNRITESGDVEFVFPNAAASGCDSIVTHHVIVNLPVVTEITDTVCDAYTWDNDDEPITASGDYTRVFTEGAANGCDSTVILHLTVKHSTHNVFTETACDSFAWNNVTYYRTDTYVHEYENEEGCPSADTLYLTINESQRAEVSREITLADIPYEWNGVTFTVPGTQEVVLTSSTDCDSTVVMTVTIEGIDGNSDDPTMAVTYNGTEDTATLRVFANQADPSAKYSINYTLTKDGEEVTDMDYDCGGRLYIGTEMGEFVYGETLNEVTGNVPQNTFHIANYHYGYFYLNFMNGRANIVTNSFTEPGTYTVTFEMVEETGGQDFPIPFDEDVTHLIGGKNSTPSADVVATATVTFTVTGEGQGGSTSNGPKLVLTQNGQDVETVTDNATPVRMTVDANGYTTNDQLAINYTILDENDEPISILSNVGTVNVKTAWNGNLYGENLAEAAGSIPNASFCPIIGYRYKYFYLDFLTFNETYSEITANWTRPGTYKIKLELVQMENGRDFPFTFGNDQTIGGKNATATGVTFDTKTLVFEGSNQTAQPAATGIAENNSVDEIAVYPNPTRSTVNVKLNLEGSDNTELHVYDMYGKMLQIVKVSDDVTEIDLTRYAGGVYMVKVVRDGKVTAVSKVVKQQ